jgi:phosphoribosylanthranilate isomerase
MTNLPKFDVKICGLKTPQAVHAALDGGASHIGFIFFEKSPRHIELDEAARLRKLATGRAQVVVVSVDADNDKLDEIVQQVKPDMLQLHGAETPARVNEIKARYGLPLMKALAIREAGDLAGVEAYTGIVDRLLFDAKPPKGSNLPGGNGVSFDWSLLQEIDVPYMLSGGLDAANIADAITIAGPPGIDISSGVESSPGVKDTALISDFLQTVRNLTNKGFNP